MVQVSGHHSNPRWNFSLSLSSLVFLWMADAATAALITYPLVPNHVQALRRRSLLNKNKNTPSSVRRRDIAQQVGALYQGYGTHYIDLWCGSPPQRQTVIVDTGSGVTAFPCNDCHDCGAPKFHVDTLFDESKSSSFHAATCDQGCTASRSSCKGGQCKISMSYAEGSRWDAFEAVDRCYIGGPHEEPLTQDDGGTDDIDPQHASSFAFDMVFGCQTLVTGLFKTQLADGIMGMDSRAESFWSQMFAAGKMGTEKKFALCFSRQPTVERGGTEAGALTLGGSDKRLHSGDMVYTTGATGGRGGFFSVKVRKIMLRDGAAGESARSIHTSQNEGVVNLDVAQTSLNQGGVIVDSGTTDTYWNRQISGAFLAAFKQLSGRDHSNSAMTLTEAEMKALPTILIQLESDEGAQNGLNPYQTGGLAGVVDPQHPNDVILAIPASHYMEYDSDNGKYTSRFYPTEGGGSVLGANSMMGHDVLFDVDNDRIGWAESDCDYTNLVTTNGYDFPITGELQEPRSDGGSVPDLSGGGGQPVQAPVEALPYPAKPPQALIQPPVGAPVEAPVVLPIAPPIAPPVEAPIAPPVEAPIAPPIAPPIEAPVVAPTNPAKPKPSASTLPDFSGGETSGTPGGGGVPTDGETETGEESEEGGFKVAFSKFATGVEDGVHHFFTEVCDTPECQYPVFGAIAVAILFGCCLAACCCCFRRRKNSYKYQRAAVAPDEELEMINGSGFSNGYKDEPSNGNGNGKGRMNGNGASYKDQPADASAIRFKGKNDIGKGQSEFQGDFI